MTPAASNDARPSLMRLPIRAPFDWHSLRGFFVSRGASACEQVDGLHYRRTVQHGAALGWLSARPSPSGQQLLVQLSPSLGPAARPLRPQLLQLFDLNRAPRPVTEQLQTDSLLAPLLLQRPGLRVPGCLQGFDLALRTVLGQQISVKAATTVYGRFVRHFGARVQTPFAGLDRGPPCAERIANCRLQTLIDRGLTRRRAQTIQALARAVTSGRLALLPQADHARTREQLLALPGIGPWTVEYVALRALGDGDAFPASDLGLLKAAGLSKPADLLARAEHWRPWRGYAAVHLWTALGAGG